MVCDNFDGGVDLITTYVPQDNRTNKEKRCSRVP